MPAQIQMQIPLDSLRFAFKFRENAPYRYYDADAREYSEAGYLAQIVNVINPNEEWELLQREGYTILLDGTVDILILDVIRCPILEAAETLTRLALRMN